MFKSVSFLGIALFLTAIAAVAQPAIPRVFSLDIDLLNGRKDSIQSGSQKFKEPYGQLIASANTSLQFPLVSVMDKTAYPPSGDKHDYMSLAPYFWPDPSRPGGLPYIRKDGQTNPEVKKYKDKEYLPRLCDAVFTLSLAWYFSGQQRYATHATQLLRTWFLDTATRMNPNLNFGQAIKGVNDGRAEGLIETRHFVRLIDGIGLLNGSGGWTRADQAGMQQWFAQFLNWMQTSPIGIDELNAANNHGTWYDAQRLSMALFIDSVDLAGRIVTNAEARLDEQMDGNGDFPRELARTTSLHYSAFVLDGFFTIAQMAEVLHRDLWTLKTPSGKSLARAFDRLYPYISKQKQWPGTQIHPYNWDESLPLLMVAARKLGCADCLERVRVVAGKKAGRAREWLLY